MNCTLTSETLCHSLPSGGASAGPRQGLRRCPRGGGQRPEGLRGAAPASDAADGVLLGGAPAGDGGGLAEFLCIAPLGESGLGEGTQNASRL